MAISRCDSAGFRILLGLALLTATWLALNPRPVALPPIPQADKWAHLASYLLLAFLADASWPARGFDATKWGALLGYGLSIELLQSQIATRMFSTADLVANALGLLLYGLFLLPLLRRRGIR